ncbi:MAG TPA: hypothetical protein VGP47_03445 [Parachlamydiaceae bacterium]|nr:hypothetical protein [Parachlamydiaceae bacterium]
MLIHKVCEAFRKEKIPYAIVGGYAVSLHGVIRGTVDVDFVIAWSMKNLQKVERALNKMGLVSLYPINAESVFHFREEYIQNRNMIAWNFYDPANALHQVDIVINYNLVEGHIETVRTTGGNINILSKRELIKMKKLSGRPQDLEDVKALEVL